MGTQLRGRVRGGQARMVVQRVVVGAGNPMLLEDESSHRVKSVLGCTGFRPDTGWIHLPGAIAADGPPVRRGGASPISGLHWMGPPLQTRLYSSLLDGVGHDADMTVRRLAAL